MRIIELRAENIKRLIAVHIKPTGELVEIAGPNGAGKSSILDSIWFGIVGDRATPAEPIRRGEREASVSLDLGEFRLSRTWRITAKGNRTCSLKLESADGSPVSSPQTVLDKLVGSLTFDPLAFTRLKPREQRDLLLSLCGLGAELTRLAGRRQQLHDDRTAINRTVERLRGQLDAARPRSSRDAVPAPAGIPAVRAPAGIDLASRGALAPGQFPAVRDGFPDTEVSVTDLAAEVRAAQEQVAVNDQARREVSDGERDLSRLDVESQQLRGEIERLQAKLGDVSIRREQLAAWLTEARAQAAALTDPDVSAIQAKIAQAEQHNALVRERCAYRQKVTELETEQARADQLTSFLAGVEAEKARILSEARFPVPGLGFTDDGVSFCDLPFDQASQSEQIRVSVAIGAALNPKLRVLLVKDGSLLDARSLALLEELAREHDFQIWIERVTPGTKAAVMIEDGHVIDHEGDHRAAAASNDPSIARGQKVASHAKPERADSEQSAQNVGFTEKRR